MQQKFFVVDKGMLLIIAGGILECFVQLGTALFLFRLQLDVRADYEEDIGVEWAVCMNV